MYQYSSGSSHEKRDAQGRVTNGAFLRLDPRPGSDSEGRGTRRAQPTPVGNFGDAFVLNENSILDTRAGYRVRPYLLVGTNYRWTFARAK